MNFNKTDSKNISKEIVFTRSSIITETPEVSTFPYFIVYIIIATVGIFLTLCSLYVGTYIYKHCKKQTIIVIDGKSKTVFPNAEINYSSLGSGENPQTEQSGDPMYLEPVSEDRAHYNEIKHDSEIGNRSTDIIIS